MPTMYKGQVAYTLEEARTRAKDDNHECAKTIPNRLNAIRTKKSISTDTQMLHTDNPLADIENYFDAHLDSRYNRAQRAHASDFMNI